MARRLIAGNWKMNGLRAALTQIDAIRDAVARGGAGDADLLICPPATLLAAAASLAVGARLQIGAQDCHAMISGAHTGDLSAIMLKDAGATSIIVGHSERRAEHGETDAQVHAKAMAVMAAGLQVIICVGETLTERQTGRALDVVARQLSGSVPKMEASDKVVIAYEPVWAIGTGLTPSLTEIATMHGFIRARLAEIGPINSDGMRILYGGSVKPDNARELLAVDNVNGALVGGASLKATDFMAIANA